MNTTLDSDILQTFTAIADTGGFTRAGERVGRTQSAVSMQMKRLEEAIGRSLFEREGRQARLTSDGELLLSYARKILRMHEEALAAFHAPEMSGLVRIGIFDDLAERFLPRILARFAKTHPLVELDVYAEDSQQLIKLYNQGRLDITLLGSDHLHPDEGEIVMSESLVWVTSQHHCTHEMDPVPVALTEYGCSWRRSAVRALQKAGRNYRICYSSRNHAGLVAPVEAGLAVSTLPLSSVREGMRILTSQDGFLPLQELHVKMLRKKQATHPAVDALVVHVRDSLSAGSMADTLPYGGLALPAGQRRGLAAE